MTADVVKFPGKPRRRVGPQEINDGGVGAIALELLRLGEHGNLRPATIAGLQDVARIVELLRRSEGQIK